MPLDLRPPRAPFFSAFGVPGTVKPVSGPVVVTTVFWAQRRASLESLGPLQPAPVIPREEHKTLIVRKDQVPTLPPGSTIEAPLLKGGTIVSWKVDRVDPSDPEFWFAAVL